MVTIGGCDSGRSTRSTEWITVFAIGCVASAGRLRWSLVEADGTVPPPSLQIVLDRLYRQALADAGHWPPAAGVAGKDWAPPPLTLTLDQYRALGGAGRILGDYVTDALDQVPARGGDRATAETLLKVMVTSQATKAALDDAEMVNGLAEADPGFDHDDAQAVACLRATRQALVNLRLVSSFKVGKGALFELAHDHMAAEIATWIGEEEMKAKLARELYRQAVSDWKRLGFPVDQSRLDMFLDHADILPFDEAGYRMVLEVAASSVEKFGSWAQAIARRSDRRSVDALVEHLENPRWQVRVAAVKALASLQQEASQAVGPLAKRASFQS